FGFSASPRSDAAAWSAGIARWRPAGKSLTSRKRARPAAVRVIDEITPSLRTESHRPSRSRLRPRLPDHRLLPPGHNPVIVRPRKRPLPLTYPRHTAEILA